MNPDERNANYDLIVRYVFKKAPTFADNNMQICAEVFKIVASLVQSTAAFARKTAAAVIPSAVAKLADAKTKSPSAELLFALGEQITLQFVLSQVYKAATGHTNPKVMIEALAWMSSAITEFGLAGVKMGELVTFLRRVWRRAIRRRAQAQSMCCARSTNASAQV